MKLAEKTIKMPCELLKRNAHNFIFKVTDLKSDIKLCTLDCSPVNAKSLLGVLSLAIKENELVRVACFNEDEKQAKNDLNKVIDILNDMECDIND